MFGDGFDHAFTGDGHAVVVQDRHQAIGVGERERIDQHGIDCDANRGGWLQAAHSKRALRRVERRVTEWQSLGVDADMLGHADAAADLGTDVYAGASRFAGGGSINPLAYAHGLAQSAAAAGALLHEQSPAIRIERQGDRWIAVSSYGAVVAGHLLCCTNAYNDNIERLHGTVIPLRTAQVATRPLPQNIASRILPGAAAASDTQRLLTSCTCTIGNRHWLPSSFGPVLRRVRPR